MKYFILTLFIIGNLAGCASKVAGYNPYSYSYMKNFVIGKTTEKEIVNVLGAPEKREIRGEYVSLSFNDPKTGYQRLLANFDVASSKLMNILWIPGEEDAEISLSNAMGAGNPSGFKVEQSEMDKVHGMSSVNFYIDEKVGKSIRYNERSKTVEGIAFFDPNRRNPASKKK